MPSEWEDRKNRLLSFGPQARGILVETSHGLFVVDPEDGYIARGLLNEGVYCDSEYQFAKSLISKGSNVLVVGAHIGAHAVRLAKDCNSLVAIEANPKTFALLQANFRLNQSDNAAAYNIAASDSAGAIKFLANRDNSGGSKRMPATLAIGYVYDDPEVIEVSTVALDDLLSPSFDFILMDIEGSEYFALKGMQRILGACSALSVEFRPHHLIDVANVTAAEFMAMILPHFQWMYLPDSGAPGGTVFAKVEILQKTEAMYQAGENHDGIFFFKELPAALAGRAPPGRSPSSPDRAP
jgi:FkbM family methyltransferase